MDRTFHENQNRRKKIHLPQRKRWLAVAAYTAETIKDIAINFDEKEIKTRLKELEELVKEATF